MVVNSGPKRPGEPQKRKAKRKKLSEGHGEDTIMELDPVALVQDIPSLFHLQTTELLKETRMKKSRAEQQAQEMEKLKDVLLNMSSGKERKLHLRNWMKNIKLPVVEEPKMTKGCFQFLPPVRVYLGGSSLLNTCVQPEQTADLFVEMPKDCFQAKDWLNHRYIRKRAMYLSALSLRLSRTMDEENIKFTYQSGNHFKPVVVLKIPVSGKGKGLTFNLHAIPEEGAFKPSRFDIRTNNVRPRWFSGQEGEDGHEETTNLPATPVYNSSILQDVCCNANAEYLSRHLQGAPSVQDAIALLKVWLHQRELDMGYGSMSGFLLSMYTCHLMARGIIIPTMGTFQVMRLILSHLSQSQWLENPVVLCLEAGQGNRPSVEVFQQYFDVVFVDTTGFLNLALGMTKSLYKRVCHEAALAEQCLPGDPTEHFDHLFITPCPFHLKFDFTFTVTLTPEMCGHVVKKLQVSDKVLDNGGTVASTVLPALLKVLDQGLGDRILLLQPQPVSSPTWSVTEEPPSLTCNTLTFGLLQHKVNSLRLLDRGPPANTPGAAKFREFWREKSELRRFQDGGILEAVVWESSSGLSHKRKLWKKIITHILNKHASINANRIRTVGFQLEDSLHVPFNILQQLGEKGGSEYGTGEERIYQIRQVLEELAKTLKKIPELALRINRVSGTHPVFRFAEPFPPQPVITRFTCEGLLKDKMCPLPLYTPALTVICSLEGSGHWPEQLDRLRDMKTLYLIDMGEKLTQMGFDVRVQESHVDVLHEGFVFRLKLGVSREVALLRTTSVGGMVKMEDTPEALALESEITTLPELTTMCQGVQQEHPSFCTTVRLIKRWLSAQLLQDHVPEAIVERMTARLFTDPLPFTAPVSPHVAFLRFLRWLSGRDCTVEPFCDKWTSSPPLVIMNWLRNVAAQSLHVLQSQPESEWKVIFKPPLHAYDLVIHLAPQCVARGYQKMDSKQSLSDYPTEPITITTNTKNTNKKHAPCQTMPVTDFDPSRMFLENLRKAYGEFALFFHDHYGGDIIAVLFKPGEVKGNTSEGENKSNVDSMLEDLTTMSKDMVTKVEIGHSVGL